MNKNERLGALAALLALLFAPPAPADFQEAYRQYVAGQYPQARAEFLALAELGSASSQYNLGAMSLHGQGTPKSMGERLVSAVKQHSLGCKQVDDITVVAFGRV